MPTPVKRVSLLLLFTIFCTVGLGVFLFFRLSHAADGSGSASMTPTTTNEGTTGNTFTTTFTAAETMSSGGLTMTVPSGWSSPQAASGVAGYTTVTTTGMLARVEDAGDGLTGWTNANGCNNGLTSSSAFKHEGAASLRCMTGTQNWSDYFYKSFSAENWSGYTKVGFWVYSSKAFSASTLIFTYDDNAALADPPEDLPVGAIPANTWTYVVLSFGATNRTVIRSFGFLLNPNLNNASLYIDDVLLGPSVPTFSGSDIRMNFLQLTTNQTVTMSYGSGGGASGVAVPLRVGAQTFDIKTRVTDAGTLTSISSLPTVTARPVATRFVIVDPSNVTVDQTGTVIVQAQDAAGNIDTTYSNDVTLSASGSATGGGLVDIVNGVGTTTVADHVAETVQLQLSDTQTTGLSVTSTQDIAFSAGVPSAFVFSASTTSMTAGGRAAFRVRRQDQYGNAIVSGSLSVYLYTDVSGGSSSFFDDGVGGNSVTSMTIANGTDTTAFWLYTELASTSTITVSDQAVTPDGATGIDDVQATVAVQPASIARFNLTGVSQTSVDDRVGFVVTRRDAFQNAVTAGSMTVYLYSSASGGTNYFYDQATGGSTVTSLTIANGTSTGVFWYNDHTAGSVSVTVSDHATASDGAVGIQDAISTLTIRSGATARFSLSDPGDMTAGSRLGYTVMRRDQYDNLVTSGSDTVYLSSSSVGPEVAFYDAAAAGNTLTSVTILPDASSASFWYSDMGVGSWTITASDQSVAPDGAIGIIDGTDAIQVITPPIAATRFVILPVSSVTAGQTATVTVQAQDASGNIDTTYSNDVTLSASGSATGGGLVDIVSGVGTASVGDTVAESVTLSLTDSQSTGLNVSSTQSLVVAPGSVSRYELAHSSDASAGVRRRYTVSRVDQYGNAVTQNSHEVYVYSDAAAGNAHFYTAADGGSITSSVTISNGSSSTSVWFEDVLAGSVTITMSDHASTPDGATGVQDATDTFTVAPAATSRFQLNDPGDTTVDECVMYTVTRQDAYGNHTSADTQTAYLSFARHAGEAFFYQTATDTEPIQSVVLTVGQASTTFCYYSGEPGTDTVTVSDQAGSPDGETGIDDATDAIRVSPQPVTATRFVVLDPTDAATGQSVSVSIEAQDDAGNIDTGYQNDVTVRVSGSATGGGLVDMINGVGTISITDQVGEVVRVTLEDTQGTGLRVDSSQELRFTAPAQASEQVSGGGGLSAAGGGLPIPSVSSSTVESVRAPVATSTARYIHLYGHAYPYAQIRIFGTTGTEQGIVTRQQVAGSDEGAFDLYFYEPFQTQEVFGFSVMDRQNRTTPTQFIRFATEGMASLERHVVIPPTVSIRQSVITLGQNISVEGEGTPGTNLAVSIDGTEIPMNYRVLPDGTYAISLNTRSLKPGKHWVQLHEHMPDGTFSDISVRKTFLVTANDYAKRFDLNGDGAVTKADMDICISIWKSSDLTQRQRLDFDGNGRIDSADLSIFLHALDQK